MISWVAVMGSGAAMATTGTGRTNPGMMRDPTGRTDVGSGARSARPASARNSPGAASSHRWAARFTALPM